MGDTSNGSPVTQPAGRGGGGVILPRLKAHTGPCGLARRRPWRRLDCTRGYYSAPSISLTLRATNEVQENFDKRDKKSTDNLPLRHFFPLKVVKQHGKVKSNSIKTCPA
jgi:hypothetical protein